MEILFLIGRIVYGGYFVWRGLNHFTQLGMMAQYAQSGGVPAPRLAVGVTGLMLILGGLSILLGLYPVVGVILLVVFLVPVAFIMHRFWGLDPQMAAMQQVNFEKNLALAGAALMLLLIQPPWPLSLGG